MTQAPPGRRWPVKFKEDARLRVVERAWEGTRLEEQALTQAYDEVEAASAGAFKGRIEDEAQAETLITATDRRRARLFKRDILNTGNARERRCCLLKEERHVEGHDSCRALCARLVGATSQASDD